MRILATPRERPRHAGRDEPFDVPPSLATSRTSLEETYEYASLGMRKTVSTSGARRRFIIAIWSSYSKSETARSPRRSTDAPIRRA
jgi:hypothetical protein